jgi:hypothetical protein
MDHGIQHERGMLAHHPGAARISSQEIGLRLRGMVLEAPRWRTNGSDTSPSSVVIMSATSSAILARLPQVSASSWTVSARPSRAECPVMAGAASPEHARELALHREAVATQRRQRARSTGKLHQEHAGPHTCASRSQ